ncbi:MAG: glycosyltransferase family 9 protein [Nitrospinae bacterium]|nr:glycosyltransferase family 9 protein [Nitrospinota bacterium]
MENYMRDFKRILIVKLGSIGDVVHGLPLLKTLRKNYPSAYIVWVVESKAREILQGNKDLDEIIVINTRELRKRVNLSTINEMIGKIKVLRSKGFDLAIDIQGLIKSGVIAYLSRAIVRIGFNRGDAREPLNRLFMTIEPPLIGKDIHVIDKNLSLLRFLGLNSFSKEFTIQTSPADEWYIDDLFKEKGIDLSNGLIVINTGVGFKTKGWPAKNYAELSRRIMDELNKKVILIWGPGEEGLVREISDMMHHKPIIPPLTTIKQATALIRRCEMFIGGDTGPLHIASALKIPTVAIFGPTDPIRNGPYGDNHTVIHKDLVCSGCYKRRCQTMECMKGITAEEVYRAVKEKVYRFSDNKLHKARGRNPSKAY